MQPIHFTYLNGPDIERLELTNDEILSAIEQGLKAQGNGETVIEPRVHLIPEDSSLGHFNVLRGVVHPLGLAGVKVVGDFVNNYKVGLPSELALLNLFDPKTGVPKAILDATSITDMRTAPSPRSAASIWRARTARYLAISGRAARSYWNVRLLNHIYDFDEIRVHSKRPESQAALPSVCPTTWGKPVLAVDSWEACVRDADIVVEASRLPEDRSRCSRPSGSNRARW